MNDPHVEKLYYKVSSGEGISYDDPEPISFSNYLGDFELNDDSLSVIPADHFAYKSDARQAIEPFLQSWEVEADLKSGIGSIRFDFDHAEIVDRDPPPPGAPIGLQAESIQSSGELGTPILGETRWNYPEPPNAFVQTTEVETAYNRWVQYKEGKEHLQNMAFFVLRLMEIKVNGHACFWVEAATSCSTAKYLRNASTSMQPISLGCRLPWKRMYCQIQRRYDLSVRYE